MLLRSRISTDDATDRRLRALTGAADHDEFGMSGQSDNEKTRGRRPVAV